LIRPGQLKPNKHSRIFCSDEPLSEAEFLQKEIGLLMEVLTQRKLSSAFGSMKRLV